MQDRIDQLLRTTPNLKRSEIARELGVSKSDVSRLLHGDKERYVQDDEYRWRLVGGEVLIALPGQWVSTEVFEKLLWSETAGRQLTELTFELEPGCRLLIESIALLLAVCNQFAASGVPVTIDFGNEHRTRWYLSRAGFFEQLHSRVDVRPERPGSSLAQRYQGGSGSLLEIGAIGTDEAANTDLARCLVDKFVQNSDERYEHAAGTMFSELINNVCYHSRAPATGFAGLQRYEGYKSRPAHIQTVVSDLGIGIPGSLRTTLAKHYPDLFKRYGVESVANDIELVTRALHGGVSESGAEHGVGLRSSQTEAAKFNKKAKFEVRQRSFRLGFSFTDGQLGPPTVDRNVFPLDGTHICFDFELE